MQDQPHGMQIPYLARHCRVLTFDGRGNGRSDRPAGVAAYLEDEFAADTLAVMDAAGTERATLVGLSCAALWATIVAADHPERVEGIVYIAPAVGLAPGHPERQVYAFEEELDTDEGWAKYNSHFWSRSYREFLEFFFRRASPSHTRRSSSRARSGGASRRTRRRFCEHQSRDLALPPGALQGHLRPRPRAYVHELYRHLAACDLAVVQGGLTTCMELTANRRPFLYLPLATISSRTSTSPTAWTATGRAGGWTTPPPTPTPSPTPSPPRSAARSTTGRWRPTAPPAPPASSPNSCEGARLEREALNQDGKVHP
jgi:pimeloyl-ACP methyl ester carboxylesterase